MIEEVSRSGSELRNIHGPARKRDCEAELALLIALAMQRQEPEALLDGTLDHRPVHRQERRGLIVPPPKGSSHPSQLWNPYCRSNARIGSILAEPAAKVS